MPEQLDLKEILKRNPQVDQKKLEEARALLRELRQTGTRGAGYNLAPPFERRRASSTDCAGDSRTVHLTRP